MTADVFGCDLGKSQLGWLFNLIFFQAQKSIQRIRAVSTN